MARRNSSLTFALCISMTVHVAALSLALWWYAEHAPPPQLAALAKAPEPAPILVAPPPPPPPPKDNFANAAQIPPRDDSGETNGIGAANRSTSGDQPMQALRGYEQANLSRNAKSQDDENQSRLNDVTTPAQAGASIGDDTPPQAAPAFGVPDPAPVPRQSVGRPNLIALASPAPAPIPQPSGDSLRQPGNLGSPLSPRNTPAAQTITPPSAPREIKGVAAVASDTDSIPFAKANSVRFHNGKLEGRKGRRVKTTRIDFGLAAEADAFSLGNATVVLGVRVDAAGNVQNVVLLHSSGSDNIDLPAERAVYNWWFEPEKDKNGRPLPDLWTVTIN